MAIRTKVTLSTKVSLFLPCFTISSFNYQNLNFYYFMNELKSLNY